MPGSNAAGAPSSLSDAAPSFVLQPYPNSAKNTTPVAMMRFTLRLLERKVQRLIGLSGREFRFAGRPSPEREGPGGLKGTPGAASGVLRGYFAEFLGRSG